MRVRDINIGVPCPNSRQENTARLSTSIIGREHARGNHFDGKFGQQGMAVALPGTIDRAAESRLHSQILSQSAGLVLSPAPPPSQVHLLQSNNVGIKAANNPSNPAGSQFAIEADTTVNVVGHDADRLSITAAAACGGCDG